MIFVPQCFCPIVMHMKKLFILLYVFVHLIVTKFENGTEL